VTRVTIGGCVLAVVLAAAPAAAEFYRWTDERGNVHYVEGLDRVPPQHRATAVPLGLRNLPPPPPGQMPPPERPGARGAASIRFTPGERIMVEARVNGRGPVRLLLDTGADRTLISPRALADAGVSTRGAVKGQITGVAGNAEAEGVTVDTLEVQDARVSRLVVISYDMQRPGYDGLLGRDFLEQFTVTIDSASGTVTLRPK
jgi:hypothetical protein